MTHRGRGECLCALNLYVISQLLISYSLILHVISKLFGTKDSGKEKCLPGVHLVHLQDEWQKRLILISSEDILYNLTSSEYMDSFFPVFPPVAVTESHFSWEITPRYLATRT